MAKAPGSGISCTFFKYIWRVWDLADMDAGAGRSA